MDLSEGAGLETETFSYSFSGPGAPSGSGNYDSVVSDGFYRHTIGFDTPNFYRKLRRGEMLPVNYFLQFEKEFKITGGWQSRTYPGQSNTYLTTYTGPHPSIINVIGAQETETSMLNWIDSETRSSAIDAAVVRLTAPKHDTLTFLSELKSTARLFVGVLKKVLNILQTVRPENWANVWLEGRYGWRTLIFDMISVEEALANIDTNFRIYSERFGLSESQVVTSSSSYSTSNYRVNLVTVKNVNVSYRGFAASKFKPRSFGFDPVITTWEIVPFSFVVDWFFNIGSKLQALSGRSYAADLQSGIGNRVDVVSTCHVESTENLNSTHEVVYYDYQFIGTYSLNIREAAVPDLIPQFNVRLDSFKILDLLALFVQQLNRR